MGYDLRNRVVLITGASSGIGRACAAAYHRAGCQVVAAARSGERLESLCREAGDARMASVTMDVTRPDDRARAVAFARERFGPARW